MSVFFAVSRSWKSRAACWEEDCFSSISLFTHIHVYLCLFVGTINKTVRFTPASKNTFLNILVFLMYIFLGGCILINDISICNVKPSIVAAMGPGLTNSSPKICQKKICDFLQKYFADLR